MSRRASGVIAIANLKGGVGKTTLALGMSYALGELGYNTLIVDLDPQAHLTGALYRDVFFDRNIFDLLNASEYRIRNTDLTNVKLLPSNLETYAMIYGLGYSFLPDVRRGNLLRRELANFDLIIIDCPPEPIFARYGLAAADYLIAPTDITELSIRGLEIFIEYIFKGENTTRISGGREPLRLLGVPIVKARRGAIYRDVVRRVRNFIEGFVHNNPQLASYIYHEPVFSTRILSRSELREILMVGRRRRIPPIKRILDRRREIRDMFEALAREVVDRIMHFRGMR